MHKPWMFASPRSSGSTQEEAAKKGKKKHRKTKYYLIVFICELLVSLFLSHCICWNISLNRFSVIDCAPPSAMVYYIKLQHQIAILSRTPHHWRRSKYITSNAIHIRIANRLAGMANLPVFSSVRDVISDMEWMKSNSPSTPPCYWQITEINWFFFFSRLNWY